jgi:hemolysin activation/secretion protein
MTRLESFLISRMCFRRAVFALGCGLYLSLGVAYAIDLPDAGSVLRLERDQLERLLQERRLRQQPVKPEVEVPAAPAAGPASQTKNIPVKGFLFDASAILSAEEIRAVLAPYEGKTLSLVDLMEAVAGLNKLYESKEMPTARAFLPPQEISDGMVKIRLVEARLGEYKLGEFKQITPDFVRNRLSLSSGDLMSVSKLENDLIRFNRLHDVQLRASVQPGKDIGTTDVQLEAAEPKRFQYSLFADNAGSYSVGEERLGFAARVIGLTGRGDSLFFYAIKAEGSDSYFLSYSVPLTSTDLKLDVSYSQGDIDVVDGAFVPLNISGASRDLTIGLSMPVVVEERRLLNVYGRLSARETVNEFGGVTQQDLDLMVLNLGMSDERQYEDSTWTYDINLNQGLQDFGGEASFFALRANAAWLGRFGSRSQTILRGRLQFSPTELLPSSELFQIGGSASVRGYSEGLLSGRSGYVLSAEWRYLLQNPAEFLVQHSDVPLFTGLVFLDHGGAFPYRPSPLDDVTDHDFLTGVGFGVQADWKSSVTARFVLGWPLRENPAEIEQREPRLHASIVFNW